MKILLLPVVLLAAASSVLSYDIDLWDQEQVENKNVMNGARLTELKSLVDQLRALEEDLQRGGKTNSDGSEKSHPQVVCLKKTEIKDVVNDVHKCYSKLIESTTGLRTARDLTDVIQCVNSIVFGIQNAFTVQTLSCTGGMINVNDSLFDLHTCVWQKLSHPQPGSKSYLRRLLTKTPAADDLSVCLDPLYKLTN